MHTIIPFLFPAICAVSAVAFILAGQAADRAALRAAQELEQLSHGNEQPPSSTVLDFVKGLILAGLFLGLIILTFSIA
jgi:hypothetical protein